jgi:putative peptide zinc metalloprotease protein
MRLGNGLAGNSMAISSEQTANSTANSAASNTELPERLPLRSSLRLHLRNGSTYVVLEDTSRTLFFRLGAPEALFVETLIESGAVEDALSRTCLLDTSFTQDSALGLCKWLMANELTAMQESNGSSPTPKLPALQAAKLNPLALLFFCKIPLVNPDVWLQTFIRYFGWLCSPHAMLVGMTCFVVGIIQTTGHLTEFTNNYENLLTSWRGLTLAIAWLVLKVIHETAHAATCRRYGGEVNEAGIAMILLMPIAYVNVTSSWRFASRWQRLQVTLAGVVAELFIAGIALIAWNLLDSPLLKQFAADVVLMASVSSLLFNLNPLLKFDGYFALADVTGIDNLYSYGQRYAHYFGTRYILGLNAVAPTLPSGSPTWIKLYGVTASVYRFFTVSGLIIAASALFQGAGVIIAIFGIFSFLLYPAFSLAKHLWQLYVEGQISPVRFAARLGLQGTLAIGPLWFIPASLNWTAPAIVQYDPPAVLRCRSAGFIVELHVRDGETVMKGQPIVTLRNEDLALELSSVRKELAQTEQQIRAAQWQADSSKLGDANSRRTGLVERVEDLQSQVDSLVLSAPTNGTLVARNLHLLIGTYVKAGHELAIVGSEDAKRLKVSITQHEAKQADEWIDRPLRIVVNDQPAFTAKLHRLETRADCTPPDISLLATNGGPLATIQSTDNKLELSEPRVNGHIPLTPAQALQLRSGQRAYVSIGSSRQSLGSFLCSKLCHWTGFAIL